jgi:hypothetical protein
MTDLGVFTTSSASLSRAPPTSYSSRNASMLLRFFSVLACPSAISSRHLRTPSLSSQLQMVPQSLTRPSIVASLGCYSTLLSHAPTWPMRSSRCVPLHARPLGAAPYPRQVHSLLCQGHSFC